MSTAHPLITASEDALRAVGNRYGKRIEKRLRAICRQLSRHYGTPIGCSTGMGLWSIDGPGTIAFRYTDDSGGVQPVRDLGDWIEDPKGYGGQPMGLPPKREAQLRELAELCAHVVDARYLPNVRVEPVTVTRRETATP